MKEGIIMPAGKPKAQTIASEKYQKKAGYVAKTFKLKKNTVEAFSKKCEDRGDSQAAAITRLMNMYINDEI